MPTGEDMSVDNWRVRYEQLDRETARLREERNAARAEAAKLQSLIDLQQTRMDAANTLWQDAHPEKEHLCPDLGDLLAWLIEERAVLKTFRQLDRAALWEATIPERISEKHRDGNWWLVWEPFCERWVQAAWRKRSEMWVRLDDGYVVAPTYALLMPPAPEGE
jgi:hypothetical protein